MTTPALADHPTAMPPGAEESRLRASETETPGPDHSAEHSQQRALARYGAPAAAGAQPVAAGNPAQDGRWGGAFQIPVHGIHAALLPTGKVMLWARPFATADNEAVAWLWDPTKGPGDPLRFKQVDPPLFTDPETGVRKPANIWCSGQSHMADGQLLVAGGNLGSPSENPPRADYAGMKTVYTFNPFNETWTEQPRMGKGRWYPSQALLPDGRTLLMSGLDETGRGANNKQVELFSPPSTLGGQGKVAKIGDRDAGQPPDGGLYPHLAVLPSGRTLVAGPSASDSWLLHKPGSGSGVGWTPLPQLSRRRLWSSGVLRPGGTGGSTAFTLIGGSQPNYSQTPPGDALGVRTSVTFDESRPLAEGWKPAPSLNVGRSHHNTVLLPDKSMVTVGGGLGTSPAGGPQDYGAGQWAADDEQRQIELFDPATNSWRPGAAQAEPRAYHSTALLLPDGRVMSAGDDQNGGADQDTAEIYEPPYLFKGARPVLDSAPLAASYGASFDVESSGPAPARAVLIAPGAVTHANDMSQRTVELALEPRPGGARLTAPARAALAPPGYYMLFLVSDQGVPSVAKWVQLEPEDKALGRSTSASTVERAGLESGKAVDGKPDTRWSSTFADNQWWQVDLGSVRQVDKVTIDWEDAYAARYRVLTSTDGTNFSVAADMSLDVPGPRTTSFTARGARYVRIEGVTRATGYGFSFYDVKVRGPDDPAPSPPPPASEHTAGKPPSAKPQQVLPDRSGPSIVFNARRGLRSRTVVRGRVSDSSGVKRMQVAVTSARNRRCRHWSPGRRRFGRASRRACARPAFFAARLRRSGGGYAWAARLGARLARGRYVVTLRAVDGRGNVATRTGRRAAHVTVR